MSPPAWVKEAPGHPPVSDSRCAIPEGDPDIAGLTGADPKRSLSRSSSCLASVESAIVPLLFDVPDSALCSCLTTASFKSLDLSGE
uniref:Uncharacterized protein n=1 Tax=Arundo donax TaxID=35708 RepID=A0A0A8YLV1_ARUDO